MSFARAAVVVTHPFPRLFSSSRASVAVSRLPPVSSRHAELRRKLRNNGVAFSEVQPPHRAAKPPLRNISISDDAAGVSRQLLTDSFGRFHDYLRVSLTERCNLRCTYCMPAHGVDLAPPETMLSDQEVLTLVDFFALAGTRKLRLTGGEPLVRSGIVGMVRRLAAMRGIESVGLTTNGLVLRRLARPLWEAGLTHVNVSLDTLQKVRFESITRRKGFNAVRAGIDAALALGRNSGYRSDTASGFSSWGGEGSNRHEYGLHEEQRPPLHVKVNCVVMRGMNDDELGAFVALTKHAPIDVRFIEWMPFDDNEWGSDRFVPFSEMLALLESQGYPTGEFTSGKPNRRIDDGRMCTASMGSFREHERAVLERLDAHQEATTSDTTKWFRALGHKGRVGFITSMSEHFCSTCNRLRVTADGKLKACLFGANEVDLKPPLRSQSPSASSPVLTAAGRLQTAMDLANLIGSAVRAKAFALGGHKDMHAIAKGENRAMIRIGG